MSSRSRAAPWHLERPEIFRPRFRLNAGPVTPAVEAWLHELSRVCWSWDGVTWFSRGGQVIYQGTEADYGNPFLREYDELTRDLVAAYDWVMQR